MTGQRTYKKYTKEELATVVADCLNFAEVCRRLGKSPVGGNTTHAKRMCIQWGISIEHMTGQADPTTKKKPNKRTPDELLIVGTPMNHRIAASRLRRCLLELGIPHECNICGIGEWQGKELVLEIDHIDGQYWNNERSNLQFICPNCHAQKTQEDLKRGYGEIGSTHYT